MPPRLGRAVKAWRILRLLGTPITRPLQPRGETQNGEMPLCILLPTTPVGLQGAPLVGVRGQTHCRSGAASHPGPAAGVLGLRPEKQVCETTPLAGISSAPWGSP